MYAMKSGAIHEVVRAAAMPLTDDAHGYDPLLELIGDARYVLLGEASHGTHEFYRRRCEITRRLIMEKGFTIVAVEADWPDAYRVNRYVRGADGGTEAIEALDGFKRFPTWMWRNTDVLEFIGWLHDYNDALPAGRPRTGFYGLDLYSLYTSIEAVIAYLDRVDPEAAQRARYRYGCFEDYGEDNQAYGYASSFSLDLSCEEDVVAQLVELQRRQSEYAGRDGRLAEDEYFFAEQNARLVRDAEEYYRTMFRGHDISWNLRDSHMARSLEALMEHIAARDGDARVAVWAHNSHLGDARATEMGERGELNLGQLVRVHHDDAVLIGFSTYDGTVTAANNWDEPPARRQVRPALPGSYEELFHRSGAGNVLLNLRDESPLRAALLDRRLERAIGVIYRPRTERISHYFHASMPQQFDAVLHIDHTRAVEPLERPVGWSHHEEVPETFPSGL